MKKLKSGFAPFIRKTGTVAPFTTIVNRSKVYSDLKVVGPVERIHVNSLTKLSKESGVNGEEVHRIDNGDSRVRFVGPWASLYDAQGVYVLSSLSGTDYIEVTAYGTGLNMLVGWQDVNAREYSVSVDGGVSTVISNAGDDVIASRNTKNFLVRPLFSNLTKDWHTYKITSTNQTAGFGVSGFELLNESTDLTILKGTAYSNGYEYTIENDTVIPSKTGFENVLDINLGTSGGNASVYIDPVTASIKKNIVLSGTPQYLTNADNSNSEAYKIINWREFGRNRGDDFSTLAGANSDRAFTLDDGLTTLVGNDVFGGGVHDGVLCNALNAYIMLTFVGTGLDISWFSSAASGSLDNSEVFVDGVSVGFLSQNNPVANNITIETICSGLKDSTHIVKINTSVDIGDRFFLDFTIYKDKSTTLPEGAIRLGEYGVMADYVPNTVAGFDTIASGVARKYLTKGATYSGTWVANFDVGSAIGGIQLYTATIGGYAEYTFLGDGFELRGNANTGFSNNITISIDGNPDFSGFTSSAYGGMAIINAVTGQVSQAASTAVGSGISVSGLGEGKHTVRFTLNAGASIRIEALDIITSIYSAHTTFGNRSIKDLRNFDGNKSINRESKYETNALLRINTGSVYVMGSKNVSQVIDAGVGNHLVYFEEPFEDTFVTLNGVTPSAYTFRTGSIYRSMIQMVVFNTAAANVDTADARVEFNGELQKDKLSEGVE